MKISKKTVLSIAYTLLFLPGVAVCFLPFTYGISPFDVLVELVEDFDLKDFSWDDFYELAPAVPFFLAFPILWTKARAVFTSRIIKFEITAFYISALLALTAECYWIVYLLIVSFEYWNWVTFLAFYCPLLVPLIAGLAFVVVILRKRIQHQITSVICMELAWLVNAIFFVILFLRLGLLKIGGWTAIFAGAIYLVDIILLTRRGWRERANEEI